MSGPYRARVMHVLPLQSHAQCLLSRMRPADRRASRIRNRALAGQGPPYRKCFRMSSPKPETPALPRWARSLLVLVVAGVTWWALSVFFTVLFFSFGRKSNTRIVLEWIVVICVPIIAGSIVFLLFTRRPRPRDPNFCPNCGYDCRASKERCPECGTVRPATDEMTNQETLGEPQ